MRLIDYIGNFICNHDSRAAQVTKDCVEDPEWDKIMYDYPLGEESRIFIPESAALIWIKSVNPLDFKYYPPGSLTDTIIDKKGNWYFMFGDECIQCSERDWNENEHDEDSAEETLRKIDRWLRRKTKG